MKKIFFATSINEEDGGGYLNKKIYENLIYSEAITIEKVHNFWGRVLCTLRAIYIADYIFLTTVNYTSILILLLSRLLNKKIMYGAYGINFPMNKIQKYFSKYFYIEFLLYFFSTKIWFLSDIYIKNITSYYPYKLSSGKFFIAGNDGTVSAQEVIKNKKEFVTIGGGRSVKGVLGICEAIKLIGDKDLILNVIGRDGEDTESIKTFPFVRYHGQLKREDCHKILAKSGLYLQNSQIETFCQSVIEAFNFKCNMIISNNIGALMAFPGMENDIVKYNDVNRIKLRILHYLEISDNQWSNFYDPEITNINNIVRKFEMSFK